MNKTIFTTRLLSILLFSVLFFSFTNKKNHDSSYATTILIEQEDGSWKLQIYSALTAFEHEVHTNYGKDSYKTPEEFNNLVIRHLLKNLFININGKETVIFKNALVKLGHETLAVFDVVGIPKKIRTVLFTNSSFKDVNNNQNTLMILTNGMKKQSFILNNINQHRIKLKVSKKQFIEK